MSHAMRRHKQMLPFDECLDILEEGAYGILGTGGTDGYPYAPPISYAFEADPDGSAETPRGRLYLHCATTGHKLDALAANPRVCFTVVGRSQVVPEELTNFYRSVITFGTAHLAEGDEKMRGLIALGNKYCPGLDDFVSEEIDKAFKRLDVLVIELEDITGKEAINLTRQRP